MDLTKETALAMFDNTLERLCAVRANGDKSEWAEWLDGRVSGMLVILGAFHAVSVGEEQMWSEVIDAWRKV